MRLRHELVRAAAVCVAIAGTLTAQQPVRRSAAPGPTLPPAPFEQPAVGTVYRYSAFTNTITGGTGLNTMYVDQSRLGGSRFAVFFNDNIREPLAYVADSVAPLFPLSVGKRVRFNVSRRELSWLFDARVVDTERVTTPAGTFDTFVIETIEAPTRTASPALAQTRVSTFWYAPAIRNVVRLMTVSTTPAGKKTLRQVQLLGIDRPRAPR